MAPQSNRATDVTPDCKTQRIAPTFRQDESRSRLDVRSHQRKNFKTWIVLLGTFIKAKVRMEKRARLLSFILLTCVFTCVQAADELYDVLGVSKTASSRDIKQAYKQLAKEWHPDKNKDPGATDKFTKINEAYETLSDPEKRSSYDRFGYTAAQEQRQRPPPRGFHSFDEFFEGFGPFGGFGGFGGRETASMEKFLVTLRHYETKLHPGSHQNPCFVYTYSDFCFNCMRIEPVIFKFMTDLENIGVCVVAVHLRRSPGLASYLRIHSAPSLLAVVSGRITSFKGTHISFEGLKDFMKSLFPSDTLQRITDSNVDSFLQGWQDNRVRAIFFSSKSQPSLRFMAPAFYNRDRIACGYVHTTSPEAQGIVRRFGINKHRESLLMWNEVTDSTLASTVMQQLSRATIDEMMSNNKYLALPRLSSQKVFDELCPLQPKLKKPRLCVALVTKKGEEHEGARTTFRTFASLSSIQPDRVKFAYIYEDVQQNFIKALTKGNETRSKLVVEVVILTRQDQRKLSYEFLDKGWGLDPAVVPESRKRLEQRLHQILTGDSLLPFRAVVPEFYNEHMLSLFTRILYKLGDWYDRIFYFCTSYDGMTLLTALAAIAFIGTVTYSMNKLAVAEREELRKKKMATRKWQQRPRSCSPDNQTIHLYELRYETFQNLVSEADTGLTITLLVDENSKEKLMRKFAEIMQPFTRYSALTFAFLQLEYYLDWYRHLLEVSMDFKVTLDSINNRNCIGSVLALNGYRKYYYIYHPKRARRWMRKEHGQNITKAVGFGDSDSDSSGGEGRAREEDVLFEDELLNGLSLWMDRVFDGSVKKVRLGYWPEMSK
ncbi:Dnaj-like protein subfamily c member 16 [Plakobranchus ocellatus]|uniref:DnaJ homolog subfamily C member 16 n=1 Tax=Plakobranchus ocellatus TaxID=259542 RepID=A0AAV3Y163_9GAST|nr:Dnaj-like protein subfamily c member 16 [Plakobranchus ocellatus]